MSDKILITIRKSNIAPRFDLTTEVLITTLGDEGNVEDEKTVVLPSASPEELCHLVLAEKVGTIICNGIEEEYYQYLNWKKVNVLDSVMGPWTRALEKYRRGKLTSGSILFEFQEGGKDA